MRFWVSLLFCIVANGAAAQEVSACDATGTYSLATQAQLMPKRSYANGSVSFAVVHDGRPRSSDSLFLVVYTPKADDPDARACKKIGAENGRGFANIALEGAEATFTAADGLTVNVPARTFSMVDGSGYRSVLSVNVARNTNEVNVSQELGPT